MASQNLNVSTANSGQGDKLRDAFVKVRQMFAEMYGIAYTSDTQNLSGTTFKVDANRVELTNTANSGTDGYVLTYDDTTGGFTLEQKFDGEIGDIVAGNGLSGVTQADGNESLELDLNDLTEAQLDTNADFIAFVDTNDSNNTKKEAFTDIVSGIAGAGISASAGILAVNEDNSTLEINSDTLRVKDDGITHDKLEGRYTAKQADITDTTGTITLDASLYAIFKLTGNLGTVQLDINNMKKGQVIDILLTGSDLSSAVITLADNFTTSEINKVGSTSLDTSKKNILQVLCADDDNSAAILNYAIATYEVATNPA